MGSKLGLGWFHCGGTASPPRGSQGAPIPNASLGSHTLRLPGPEASSMSPVFHVGAGGWRRGAQRVGALSPQHPLLLPPGGPFLPRLRLRTHRLLHPSMSPLPLPSPALSGDTPPHSVPSPAGSPFLFPGGSLCPPMALVLSQMPSSSSDLLFSPGAPSFPGCPHHAHTSSLLCTPFSRDSPAPLISPLGSPPVQVPPSLPGVPSSPSYPCPRPIFTQSLLWVCCPLSPWGVNFLLLRHL